MRKLGFQEAFTSIAAIATLTVAVSAAPVTSITYAYSDDPFAVSNTDLLEGLTPDTSSIYHSKGVEDTSLSPSVLTDGLFGDSASQNPNNRPQVYPISVFAIGDGSLLVYTLPVNPGGYNITGISTYTGWSDVGRVQQNYIVSYALTSDPTMFIDLVTVASGSSSKNAKADVSITDLSDVVALRFSFPTQQNGYVGYREIDVFGGAAIPEPASLSIPTLGALGLLTRRRKATLA